MRRRSTRSGPGSAAFSIRRAHAPSYKWLVYLLILSAMVLLVSLPSPNRRGDVGGHGQMPWPPFGAKEVPGASSPLSGRSIRDKTHTNLAEESKDPSSSVPVLVECVVTTPHSNLPREISAGGVLRISVRPDLAPQSSAAFLSLIESNYYDGAYIFRVVKGFVAQFGMQPSRWEGTKPMKPSAPDPVLPGRSLSNVRGTVSFAGGNVRSGQVFINLGNNARLDKENNDDGSTRPFGTVDVEGMAVADKLYSGYKEGQGQVKTIKEGGEAAVAAKFPNMSQMERCRLV